MHNHWHRICGDATFVVFSITNEMVASEQVDGNTDIFEVFVMLL